MTVFDAERLVQTYRAAPQGSPIGEAAKLQCLLGQIRHGLPDSGLWSLCERLGYRRARTSYVTEPPLTVLARLVDRRAKLGVGKIEPDEEQRLGRRGRLLVERRAA